MELFIPMNLNRSILCRVENFMIPAALITILMQCMYLCISLNFDHFMANYSLSAFIANGSRARVHNATLY